MLKHNLYREALSRKSVVLVAKPLPSIHSPADKYVIGNQRHGSYRDGGRYVCKSDVPDGEFML